MGCCRLPRERRCDDDYNIYIIMTSNPSRDRIPATNGRPDPPFAAAAVTVDLSSTHGEHTSFFFFFAVFYCFATAYFFRPYSLLPVRRPFGRQAEVYYIRVLRTRSDETMGAGARARNTTAGRSVSHSGRFKFERRANRARARVCVWRRINSLLSHPSVALVYASGISPVNLLTSSYCRS